MKKIYSLLVIFLLTGIYGYSQSTVVDGVDTKMIQKQYFDSTANTDVVEQFYVIKTKPTVKHGTYKKFNTLEVLFEQGEYRNGQKSGAWKTWWEAYPNYPKSEGNYTNGIKDGEWKFYSGAAENQLSEKIVSLKNETLQSVERFYENGKLKNKGLFELHDSIYQQVGHWVTYYQNETTETEGDFVYNEITKKSIKTAQWIYLYENSNLKNEENYDIDGNLDGKKTYFSEQNLLEKNEYYKAGKLDHTEDKYDFQKQDIEPLWKSAQTYENDQPTIFKNEITQLNTQYTNYLADEKNEDKYTKGKNIFEQLKIITNLHDSLNYYDTEINALFTKVNDVFKQNYPTIYKNEVQPYANKVDDFKQIGLVVTKQKSGKELFAQLTEMGAKAVKFQEQEKIMTEKTPIIKSMYRDTFPAIFAVEITSLEPMKLRYDNFNSLQQKLDSGKVIVDMILNLETNFPKMKSLDKEISSKFPLIQAEYKEKYPQIFKGEILQLQTEIAKYKQISYLNKKIEIANNEITFLGNLEENLVKLKNQNDAILLKFQDFISKFKEDKNNKYLFKKGKKLYEAQYERYEKEPVSKSRIDLGEDILLTLTKLNSYYQKDNTYLNSQLKEADEITEIKSVLGL